MLEPYVTNRLLTSGFDQRARIAIPQRRDGAKSGGNPRHRPNPPATSF
jgi:hypothetical protein